MRSILFSLLLCFSVSLNAQNVTFTATTACLGQQNVFIGSYTYEDSVQSWKWDFDNDGQFDDGTGRVFGNTFLQAGSFPVKLKVVLVNGSADSMTVPINVTVNPLPQVNFSVENMCEGQTAIFTSTSTISSGSIGQYIWDFKNDGTDNDTGPVVTFNCGPAETYQSKLRCVSDSGCEAFALKTTQVYNIPQPSFLVTSSCLGGNTVFQNNSSIAAGNIDFYLWEFGDGDSSVNAAPTHVYNAEQSYNVKLTAISGNACRASFSDSLNIVQVLGADFSITNTCLGGTTQFTNNTTTGSEIVNSYSWDFGDASTGITSGNASHEYASEGNYTVILTAVSQNGCIDSQSKTLTISQLLTANFSASSGCLGVSTSFNNTSSTGGEILTSLIWNFGDGTSATTSDNATHEYAATGTYNISMMAVSQNACRDTVTGSVIVYQLPAVTLEISGDTINDSTMYEGDKITITVEGSASLYSWSTGASTSGITVSDSGNFTVTATNANGCSQTLSKKIIVKDIPDTVAAGNDIITPNGDGINDEFVIMDVSGYLQCAITIYNMWNEEVFSSSGYKNDWNGKNKNGNDLDAGAYFYILKCDDKEQTIGTVNILR